MAYTINCIGCGRLGKTLLRLIADSKIGLIYGIVNRTIESANKAVAFINQGTAYENLRDLPLADVYLIGANDSSIAMICQKLVKEDRLKPSSIVMHCSGFLSSDILVSAKKVGCLIASVHPVKSFANPEIDITTFKKTFCGFEGDDEAFAVIDKIFNTIGGVMFNLKKENKKRYHAAMVMANNYLTTLHYHATQNLIESGVESAVSKQLVSMMMNDSLHNLENLDHKNALTGPIQRGDKETIQGHVDALKSDKISADIYSFLGKGTLSLTDHKKEIKEEIEKILDGESKM